MSNETKKIHLALQGGGAHGAFTWGVLDALLTDGRLQFAGISGTSAGALNAVAVGHGWARAQGSEAEPAEEARVALAHIWRRVMNLGAMSEGPGRLARLMLGALPGAWGRVSPYQSNPLDYNPLRQLVTEAIDFDGVARLQQPRVFVAATEVETGRAEIFSGKRLTANAVMASCCLPQLFHAPEINGKTYWDGGYSSNPALQPLIEMGETDDILLVQINPLRRRGTPAAVGDIAARIDDLTFNASLILFDVLIAALAIPSLLALMNTLAISVLSRRREIGMLRAIGSTRRQIRRMVLAESLLLSLIATVLGLVAGLWLGYGLVAAMAAIGWQMPYAFPWDGLLVTIVVGLVFGLLAALGPSRQAAHLNVIEALRQE